MLRKYVGFAAASAVAVGLFASPAHATFSVVGADTSTRDVGGALTTCGNLPLGDAT